jgi:formate hydrogenlyase transcriptional activator
MSKDKSLRIHLPMPDSIETEAIQDFQEMERRFILTVLEKTGWRLSGDGGAAEVLGLKRTTLHAKMKKLGIKRPTK